MGLERGGISGNNSRFICFPTGVLEWAVQSIKSGEMEEAGAGAVGVNFWGAGGNPVELMGEEMLLVV